VVNGKINTLIALVRLARGVKIRRKFKRKRDKLLKRIALNEGGTLGAGALGWRFSTRRRAVTRPRYPRLAG